MHGVHRGKKLFLETVYDGVGEVVRGEIDEATLKHWEDKLFPGPGAGATLTSGNTAGIYTEALGMSLPGIRDPARRVPTSSCGPPSTPGCAPSS